MVKSREEMIREIKEFDLDLLSDKGLTEAYDHIVRGLLKENEFDPNKDYLCVCGHAYERHFDSYEDWEPVGCKYCSCGTPKPVYEGMPVVILTEGGPEYEEGQETGNITYRTKVVSTEFFDRYGRKWLEEQGTILDSVCYLLKFRDGVIETEDRDEIVSEAQAKQQAETAKYKVITVHDVVASIEAREQEAVNG